MEFVHEASGPHFVEGFDEVELHKDGGGSVRVFEAHEYVGDDAEKRIDCGVTLSVGGLVVGEPVIGFGEVIQSVIEETFDDSGECVD